MDDSMRRMMTIIDSIYDVVFGSCNAIDNPTRYYGRTIELGQHRWGYVMQEQVTLYHTRGLGEGGECDDGIYYFGTLEVVE